jgi:hypothetical protein
MKRIAGWLPILATISVLLAGVPGIVAAEEHAYVGSQKCKMCHLKEWKSWSETKMAKAFDVLKPGESVDKKKGAGLDPSKDYTTDAKCVRCHVTGYGKKGGFTSIEATPGLVGVGCEMCHGAGGTYTQAEHMSLQNKNYKKADLVAVGLTDKITEKLCTGCHNSESPLVGPKYVFDFEARKAQGTHEKAPLKFEH